MAASRGGLNGILFLGGVIIAIGAALNFGGGMNKLFPTRGQRMNFDISYPIIVIGVIVCIVGAFMPSKRNKTAMSKPSSCSAATASCSRRASG